MSIEFRIWNGALTDTEVAANQIAGPNNLVPEPRSCLSAFAAISVLSARRRR